MAIGSVNDVQSDRPFVGFVRRPCFSAHEAVTEACRLRKSGAAKGESSEFFPLRNETSLLLHAFSFASFPCCSRKESCGF